jgi:integrase
VLRTPGCLIGLRAADRSTLDLITAYGGSRLTQLLNVRQIAALPAMLNARGELRAARVFWVHEVPLTEITVHRSHSDNYDEKDPKSWRGTRRSVPLSPRARAIIAQHSLGKDPDDYLFTNSRGDQLAVGVIRKYPLGFRRHALRHFAASRWLQLGTPINEVAEYLGDDPRVVMAVYAHILGADQRREHLRRLAAAESTQSPGGHLGVTRGTSTLGM